MGTITAGGHGTVTVMEQKTARQQTRSKQTGAPSLERNGRKGAGHALERRKREAVGSGRRIASSFEFQVSCTLSHCGWSNWKGGDRRRRWRRANRHLPITFSSRPRCCRHRYIRGSAPAFPIIHGDPGPDTDAAASCFSCNLSRCWHSS